jgi:serine acetyltransferase
VIAPSATLGRDVQVFQPDLVNLYGCGIGDGTKIGAGAVATRDVPAYAIAAGVPARLRGDVRRRTRHNPNP